MPTLTEGNHTGEFILSEANGDRSRETVTVVSGQDLAAGTVVGRITASQKIAVYNDGAGDGTETAVGVLYAAVDASAADAPGVIIARDAEVESAMLTSNDANGTADLLALGIIVR